METHDLVLAKCVAGREKDWAFAREAMRAGLVSMEGLRQRAAGLPVPADLVARVLVILGRP